MALLVADEFPSADIDKVVKMCLIHDFGEAITGDIPSFLKTELDEQKEDAAIADMLERLPGDIASEFSGLFSEMAELKTIEAKLFKALDKLEAVISHNESSLDTWLPNEYSDNLTYGNENVGFSEYLGLLRDEIKADTIRKIENTN
jgi:putative hydrolase of HD superfamily